MPKNEITVVKSPISQVELTDGDIGACSNELTYYVRLSNGMIATKPEDFPDDHMNEREFENEADDDEAIDE